MLWRIARRCGAITPAKAWRYHFEFAAFREVFRQALDEVDAFGWKMLAAKPEQQEMIAERWMRQHVEYNPGVGYSLPDELAGIYDRLRNLPEEAFEPPVSMVEE